jgi:prepilin-type N-terminal cleavage/methylation domain-containing protein
MREVDRQKGFTLIEVLVALGLGSIVLIATVQFIFSLQRVWNETKLTNSFEQHMDGTTFFLQFLLNNSTALEETNEQNGNSGTIQIVKPQWSRGFNEGMLCFVAEPPLVYLRCLIRLSNRPLPFIGT